MTPRASSFFAALNDATAEGDAPFLNFGFVPLDETGRPRSGRRSPTGASIALLRQLVAGLDTEDRTVAEVGCGRGGNLRWLRRHRGADRLVAVDLEASSVRRARRALGSRGLLAVAGDAAALPLAPAAVGGVLSVESSCLYPDLAGFYGEVARVLRTDGWFAYADIMTTDLAATIPAHLAALGLDCDRAWDITSNVRASLDAHGPEHRQARGFLDWFVEALGREDLGYFCFRAVRRSGGVPSTVEIGPAARRGARELRRFVDEAMRRAQAG